MFRHNKISLKENYARKEAKEEIKVQNKKAKLHKMQLAEVKANKNVAYNDDDFDLAKNYVNLDILGNLSSINPTQFKITNFNHLLIITLLLSSISPASAQMDNQKNRVAHLDEANPTGVAEFANSITSEMSFKTLTKKVILTNDMSCQKKTDGRTKGKRCLINQVDYMLKEVGLDFDEEDEKLSSHISYNPYYAIFSKKLIENMSKEIRQPDLTLFYEVQADKRGIYFLGSQIIEDLELAQDFLQEVEPEMKRQALINAIGLKNFHYLFVIGTFIPDSVKMDNWGRDGKGNLVFLDGDDPSRITFENYYQCATMAARFFADEEIKLSLADVIAIKEIYLKMKQSSPPATHQSVNLTHDAYSVLLETYIAACDQTLSDYDGYQLNTLHSDLAATWINNLLAAFLYNSEAQGLFTKKVATFKKSN